jgi:murein DD-endopeptidase MepM/ murein hydrolase activator NlpD
MGSRATFLACAAAAAALMAPAPALAAATPSGGAAVPHEGGAHYGETPVPSASPRLALFSLSSRTLSTTVKFRFRAPARVRDVRVQLLAAKGSRVVRTVSLGTRRAGRTQSAPVSKNGLRAGAYRLRLTARGLRGTHVAAVTVPRPLSAPVTPVPDVGHVFPVRGTWTFGGADARFGAGRSGHTHQGQDVVAAQGTPVVAPAAGTVKAVRYQACCAGYYVVVTGTGEDRDYVFMHFAAGTTLVREGQAVRAGEQLGQVGATGDASGPHLHFEVWVGGGWYTGGHPVDPLPLLEAWAG